MRFHIGIRADFFFWVYKSVTYSQLYFEHNLNKTVNWSVSGLWLNWWTQVWNKPHRYGSKFRPETPDESFPTLICVWVSPHVNTEWRRLILGIPDVQLKIQHLEFFVWSWDNFKNLFTWPECLDLNFYWIYYLSNLNINIVCLFFYVGDLNLSWNWKCKRDIQTTWVQIDGFSK